MADETWKMDFEALRESELNRDSYLEYLREYEIIETYKLEMTKKSCKEQTVKVLEEMSGTLKSDPPRPTSASAPVDVIVSAIEVFEDMKVLSAIRVFDEFPEQVYATAHPDLAIKTGVHLLPALDVFVEMPIPVVVAEIGAELAHAGGSICILGVESVVTTATKKLDIFKVFEEMSVPLKWVNESVCTSNFQQGNSRITSSILILELHKFVLGNYEPWDPGGLTHATILQECISGHATCCLKLKVFWEASWICSKLQDVELWNLLDTKRDVQRRIVHVTCPRSAEEDEVLGQGCLAIDIIERADNAVDKLNFLKASKMREQNELEEIYRGIHMAEALIMIMKKIEGLVKMSTTSDDATESVVGQIMPSLSFFIVDSKSSKECPSHLDKINQCEGNNIMDEPPSVKEFAVLLPFEGELEDSQIRKLEFPSLPEGNLVDSHFEEEHESITEPSVVLGATGLHVLKEHDLCLHNTKQQPSSGLKSGEDIEDYIDNKLLHKECNAELEFNQEGLNVVSSPDEKLESTKPIEYLVSQEQSQLEQCDTICNLNAISSSTGFGDMHFVLFQIEVNHRLPQITLSPGDMVCVRICNRRGAEAASCMQGFVNNLGEVGCSITVASKSCHGDPTFSKIFGKSVRIDRIPEFADAMTYERNCKALVLPQKNRQLKSLSPFKVKGVDTTHKAIGYCSSMDEVSEELFVLIYNGKPEEEILSESTVFGYGCGDEYPNEFPDEEMEVLMDFLEYVDFGEQTGYLARWGIRENSGQKFSLGNLKDEEIESATKELGNCWPLWVTKDQIFSLLRDSKGDVEAVTGYFEHETKLYEKTKAYMDPTSCSQMHDTYLVDRFISMVTRLEICEWFTPRVSSCWLFHIAYPSAFEVLKVESLSLYGQLCQAKTWDPGGGIWKPSVRGWVLQSMSSLIQSLWQLARKPVGI